MLVITMMLNVWCVKYVSQCYMSQYQQDLGNKRQEERQELAKRLVDTLLECKTKEEFCHLLKNGILINNNNELIHSEEKSNNNNNNKTTNIITDGKNTNVTTNITTYTTNNYSVVTNNNNNTETYHYVMSNILSLGFTDLHKRLLDLSITVPLRLYKIFVLITGCNKLLQRGENRTPFKIFNNGNHLYINDYNIYRNIFIKKDGY